MQKESSNKFPCVKGHCLDVVVFLAVFIREGDTSIVDRQNAIIGNSNPMSIASKIIQYLFGTVEGWFYIDNPIFIPGALNEFIVLVSVGIAGNFSWELQFIILIGFFEKCM